MVNNFSNRLCYTELTRLYSSSQKLVFKTSFQCLIGAIILFLLRFICVLQKNDFKTDFKNWRRVRDSNPRGLSPSCFPSKYHRPLGELSGILFFIAVDKKFFISTISPISPQ